MITNQIDTEVTKNEVAGILRKAKIVRTRKVVGGKSTLRDVTRNETTYSGVEITERKFTYNRNANKPLRPRWEKVSEGKFDIAFTYGEDSNDYTKEEAIAILDNALKALLTAGFIQVDGLKYRVAKMVA